MKMKKSLKIKIKMKINELFEQLTFKISFNKLIYKFYK